MNNNIPYTFTASKYFFALSLKTTKLHLVLKHINKYLCYLSNNQLYNLTQVNYHLLKAASLAEIDISSITQAQLNTSLSNIITQVKQYKHTIWQTHNFEKKQKQSERIKFFTN